MGDQADGIGVAVTAALSAGLEVKFIPYGPEQFVFALLDRATERGVDVEVPIKMLAYPDAFVRQYVQPALAQLRSDAVIP